MVTARDPILHPVAILDLYPTQITVGMREVEAKRNAWRDGGFAKDTTPFSEFLWADFLRRRMKRKEIERNFDKALEQALNLARTEDADYLPGWCGPAVQ